MLAPASILRAPSWGTLDLRCWVYLPAPVLWPLRAPIPGLPPGNAAAISYLDNKGNVTPLQGPLLSLAFLIPASLIPSAVRPLCPPDQIIFWSQIITAEHLQFEFAFQYI